MGIFWSYVNYISHSIFYFFSPFNPRYNILKKPLHVTIFTPNPLFPIATRCPRASLSCSLPLSPLLLEGLLFVSQRLCHHCNHTAMNIVIPGLLRARWRICLRHIPRSGIAGKSSHPQEAMVLMAPGPHRDCHCPVLPLCPNTLGISIRCKVIILP